jgi:hypothetical protein
VNFNFLELKGLPGLYLDSFNFTFYVKNKCEGFFGKGILMIRDKITGTKNL